MNPHIYFWPPQVEHFKRNNLRVKILYEDTMIDKDKIWEKYEGDIKTEVSSIGFGPNDDPSDLSDIYAERLSDAADILWHAVAIHKFQFLVLLCQTWENEFISFVTEEFKKSYELDRVLTYGEAMDDILLKSVGESKVRGLGKIRELRSLVNVIKHGEGHSAEKLRSRRPDFFQYDSNKPVNRQNDRLVVWNSVLLDGEALNVDESEFYNYFEAINEFWRSMPIRVFLDGNLPVYEENGSTNDS